MLDRTTIPSGVVLVVLGVALGASAAAAQPAPEAQPTPAVNDPPSGSDPTPPWGVGVAPDDRAKAQVLFTEANELVEGTLLAAAVDKYEKALEYWDHPNIRRNLAVVLMEMDNPISAYRHYVAAIQYGEVGLGPENYKRAKQDLRLLRARLVSISVRCKRAGVQVTINGRKLVECPGETENIVESGPHQWLARGSGLPTAITTHAMWGNHHYDVTVDSALAIERRWPAWKPWAVVGGGALLAVASGALYWRARENFASFDDWVADHCPDGCTSEALPADVADLESTARWQNDASRWVLAIGGATLVAGGVLLFLNRPLRDDTRAFEFTEMPFDDVAFTPLVTPDAAGIAASRSF